MSIPVPPVWENDHQLPAPWKEFVSNKTYIFMDKSAPRKDQKGKFPYVTTPIKEDVKVLMLSTVQESEYRLTL